MAEFSMFWKTQRGSSEGVSDSTGQVYAASLTDRLNYSLVDRPRSEASELCNAKSC